MTAPPRPSPLAAALLIALASTGLRIAWVAFADVTPISDFAFYDKHAKRLLAHGEFGTPTSRAYITPGYPLFLAGVYAIAGDHWKTAAFAQAALGGLTSGLLVLLAGFLLCRRVGVLAGVLHALSPTALAYTPLLASENLAAPLVVGCLLALLAAQRVEDWRKLALTALCGALFSALLMVRPVALFIGPPLLLLAVWRPLATRRSLLAGGAWFVAAGLVVLPWSLRNQQLGLSPFTLSTHGGYSWYQWIRGVYPPGVDPGLPPLPAGDQQARDQFAKGAVRDWIRTHPGYYAQISRVQFAKLIGTTPDTWAAAYLPPTAARDALIYARENRIEPALDPAVTERERRAEIGVRQTLSRLRRATAPLALLAFFLAFARFRTFALILLPIATYTAGVSLTICIERYREFTNPLWMLLIAALFIDLFSNRPLLCPPLARNRKAALAIAAIALGFALHAFDWDAWLYEYPAFAAG